MIVFIVLINDHITAFYTWYDFSSEKHASYLLNNSRQCFSGLSIECSIVIIDQTIIIICNHHYNGKCVKGSGDFLSALC